MRGWFDRLCSTVRFCTELFGYFGLSAVIWCIRSEILALMAALGKPCRTAATHAVTKSKRRSLSCCISIRRLVRDPVI